MPCSLRSSRPSDELDFPACNVQNTPCLLPHLAMSLATHLPPLIPHVFGRLLSQAMHVLPPPAPSILLQTQQPPSGVLALWQRRSRPKSFYLFMWRRQQWSGRRERNREGRHIKEVLVGQGPTKYLYNFNCFLTTLSLARAPRVKGLFITRDESL